LFSIKGLSEVFIEEKDVSNILAGIKEELLTKSLVPVSVSEHEKLEFNYLNGIFVATNIDWDLYLLEMKSKGYISYGSRQILNDMKLSEKMPPEKLEKAFPQKYCEAAIKLTRTSWKSITEIKNYLIWHLKEEKVASTDADAIAVAEPILKNWLVDSKINEKHSIFEVVEFEIKCTINLKAYIESLLTKETGKNQSAQNQDRAIQALADEARKVSEILSESVVYKEFKSKFEGMNGSPFIPFSPCRFRVKLEKFGRNEEKVEHRLGKKISIEIIIENIGNNELVKTDANGKTIRSLFKVEIEPDCFEPIVEDAQIRFLSAEDKIIVPITIKQLVDKVLAAKTKVFKIKVKVISKVNQILLGQVTEEVVLENPEFELISGIKDRVPFKGEQFKVTVKAKLPSDYDLKIKVKCTTSDFETIKPGNGEVTKQLVSGNEQDFEFILSPKRAGFWGYKNRGFFDFFVEGSESQIESEAFEIIVLPNMLDTTIAALTGILLLAAQFYPTIFPPLTEGLSLTNLPTTAAAIYLGFRGLSWGWKTQKSE
jgi:hypothetical protein